MATPSDATINIATSSVVSSDLPSVTNADPINDAALQSRTTQQQILPTAIQDKFLSPVKQWPAPGNINSIVLNDLSVATTVISDGVGSNPGSVSAFAFNFTGSTSAAVSVELCAALFIDSVDFAHAYPFGVNVAPTQWQIERIKSSFYAPDFSSDNPTYQPNQSNQDSEWYIIKFLGSGTVHQLSLYYYWRAIANQGGNKA